MNEFAFDIETCPNNDVLHLLPKPTVKFGNTKDPAKRLEKEKEAKQKQIEDMALNPFFARICSYAVYGTTVANDTFSTYQVVESLSDNNERKLIESIFLMFSNTNTTAPLIITWNGTDFDMRFLYTRAALLGVSIPSGFHCFDEITAKYKNEHHVDLMKVLCNYGQRLKLDVAAEMFLGEQKLDHDFSKFVELIESGKGDEIGKYNLQDTKLTYEIYQKVKPYFINIY
jgi:DNA polymerase elongation subunit (family B)